ncbi:hypothetical protein [Chryseosolibacter indicus]|uniref:START domain-containing protein n=1 Tax=Chryseosolibacter indicus TaxID=2782351 RepID=A0ABS5VYD5_9BACT|nr:hypothetical protein [Chryseosolibacter indicus]MBT1705016.1 hypothetical protein [Chryseosolibacter indicus]
MIFSHKTHFIFFSFILLGAFHACSQEKQDEGFQLVKEDGNISVYERWITFPKSNPPVRAREVKGEFTVRATIKEALALVQNESKIYEWQKHVSKFKVYLQKDTSVWYEYSYHDLPWPVSDQDHYLEYRIQEGSTSNRLFVVFETATNDTHAPVDDDATRMVLAGSWLFEEVEDNKIKIAYRILSMPGNIPRIFTDPVIRSNLLSTIKSYIKILEEPQKKASLK